MLTSVFAVTAKRVLYLQLNIHHLFGKEANGPISYRQSRPPAGQVVQNRTGVTCLLLQIFLVQGHYQGTHKQNAENKIKIYIVDF